MGGYRGELVRCEGLAVVESVWIYMRGRGDVTVIKGRKKYRG